MERSTFSHYLIKTFFRVIIFYSCLLYYKLRKSLRIKYTYVLFFGIGFLEFVRSQDTDLIRLGLTYFHLLITQVPSSRQLLESLNAIDAVESVTLSEDQDLKMNASRLMDLYFGENFAETEGMDEASGADVEGDVNGQLVEKVDV